MVFVRGVEVSMPVKGDGRLVVKEATSLEIGLHEHVWR